MHCRDSHIESMLIEAEPVIRAMAGRISFPLHSIDADDVRQYLRIEIWRLAETFDAPPEQWTGRVARFLRWRIADLMRRYGANNRKGERKRNTPDVLPFSVYGKHYTEHGTTYDPADQAGNHVDVCAFRDLEAACEGESMVTRAIIKRAQGLRLRDIAEQEGVCESRISQVLVPSHPSYLLAMGRLRVLTGEQA